MTRKHFGEPVHLPDLETDEMYLSATGTHNAACPSRKEPLPFKQTTLRPL